MCCMMKILLLVSEARVFKMLATEEYYSMLAVFIGWVEVCAMLLHKLHPQAVAVVVLVPVREPVQ